MADSQSTCVGRISGVFGIKGWVKVISFTEPVENIFAYSPWRIGVKGDVKDLEVDEYQQHKGGWIVRFKGVNDRNIAETLKLSDIFVDQTQFTALDEGEYYWHQLIGLRVVTDTGQQKGVESTDYGCIHSVMETGANDVLVVKPDDSSIDQQERLIPYVPDRYVKHVDLAKQHIVVDWHIDD